MIGGRKWDKYGTDQNFQLSLLETYLSWEQTLPGGVPMMRLQSESRALLMLAQLPMRWMVLSARMILVLVAFSMACLVLPFSPEIRAMQRERWSPCRFFTSLIWKVSRKRSSSRSMAMASSRLKPSMKARRKSQVRWMAERSSVSSHSRMSTVRFFMFMRICSFMFLTTVSQIFSQLPLRGVMRLGGMSTDCCSKFVFPCAGLLAFFSGASIICQAYIVEVNIIYNHSCHCSRKGSYPRWRVSGCCQALPRCCSFGYRGGSLQIQGLGLICIFYFFAVGWIGDEREQKAEARTLSPAPEACGEGSEGVGGGHLPPGHSQPGEDVSRAEAVPERAGAGVHRAVQHPARQSNDLLGDDRERID